MFIFVGRIVRGCLEVSLVKLSIMVVKKDQNWNSLVKSLEKRLKEEAKTPTKEPLNAVEVICSHEDIERTRRG
jgi:hypothetical protein